MNRSDSISQLACALAKAQSVFESVEKRRKNPHLGNMYATLDDIIAAVRGPLSANGLSFIQPLNSGESGWVLETVLMHESGEWISCAAGIPNLEGNRGVNALQSFGGALTYMRRYMLSALLGVNTEEDGDGDDKPKQPARPKQPEQTAEPQQQPPSDPVQPPAPHWIEDPSVRQRFWGWTRERLGLKDGDIYQALGVEHVHDYPGTMQDAKNVIEAWVHDRASA